jgi:hypothetical protein
MISTRQIVFLIEINGVCVRREARPGANIYPKAMIRLMYTMEN